MAKRQIGDQKAGQTEREETSPEQQAARKMAAEAQSQKERRDKAAKPDDKNLPKVEIRSKVGFNGEFRSMDGKEKYSVRENKMYDANGKEVGEVTADGKFKGADGSVKDLNAFRQNWVFDGSENGQRRVFITGSDASNGRVFVPDAQGQPHEYQVKMGAIIDKQTGEQCGLFQPPTERADGKLAGGALVMFVPNGTQAIELEKTKNIVFDLHLAGQVQDGTGLAERQVQGVSTGNGMLNLQEVKEEQARRKQRAQGEYQAIEDSNYVSYAVSFWSGDEDEARAKSAKVAAEANAVSSEANAILSNGSVSAEQIAHLSEATEQAKVELGENAKPAAEQPKPIEIPAIETAEQAATVNGKLRVGQEIYEVRNGDLYRVHADKTVDERPCGKLGAGYTIERDGSTIALANENRVLMEFTICGASTKHQIIGFGRGHSTEHMGRVDGGLVDVNELQRQSDEARQAAAEGNAEYFRNRPYLTGALVEKFGGFEDTLKSLEGNLAQENRNLQLSVGTLFEKGFDADRVDTRDFDLAANSTQIAMKAIGATSMDAQALAVRCGQTQELIKESAIIAATTVATAGFGAALGGSAAFGEMAFATRAVVQVGGSAIIGSAIRTAGGASDGADYGANAMAGLVEGGTMGTGALLGEAAKMKQLAELKALRGAPLSLAEQTALKVAANPYAAKAAEVAGVVGNGAVQTTGFHAANNIRNHRDVTDGMSVESIAAGTLAMSIGHGMGKLANRSESVLGTVAENSTNAFSFGTVSGYHNAKMQAREEVAKQLGVDPSAVSDEVLMQHVSRGKLLNQAIEEGALAALTAVPLGAAMHGINVVAKNAYERKAAERPLTAGSAAAPASEVSAQANALDVVRASDRVTPTEQGGHEIVDAYGAVRVADSQGRIVETRSPEGKQVKCEYDATGLKRVEDGNFVYERTEQGEWTDSYKGGEPRVMRNTRVAMDADGALRITDNGGELRMKPNGVRETLDPFGKREASGHDYEVEVQVARAEFEQTIDRNFSLNAQERQNLKQRFNESLEMLEGRAVAAPDATEAELAAARNGDRSHIEARKAQFAEMLSEVTRLVSGGETSKLNSTYRLLLAEEILQNAAHPNLVAQGGNNTCAIAGSIERPLYETNPSEAARIVADIALTGVYTDHFGGQVDMRLNNGVEMLPDRDAYNRIQHQKQSTDLNPPLDSDGRTPRGFSSGIIQKTLVNLYWQNSTHAPDGTVVNRGDLAYVTVGRSRSSRDTGERVIDVRTGREYSDNGHNNLPPDLVTGPGLNTSHVSDVRERVGLRTDVITGPDSRIAVGSQSYRTSTAEELRTALTALQENGRLPIGVVVDINRPPFSTTGHDISQNGGVAPDGCHMVTVNRIYPDGKLDLVNNWGIGDDFVLSKAITAEELFGALYVLPTEAGEASRPSSKIDFGSQTNLKQLANQADVADHIDGPVEVFLHGTTQERVDQLVNNTGKALSNSGGNFGGRFFGTWDARIAEEFAGRTVSKLAHGAEKGMVGLAIPEELAKKLQEGPNPLMRVKKMDDRDAQEVIFEPGAIEMLQRYGYFFDANQAARDLAENPKPMRIQNQVQNSLFQSRPNRTAVEPKDPAAERMEREVAELEKQLKTLQISKGTKEEKLALIQFREQAIKEGEPADYMQAKIAMDLQNQFGQPISCATAVELAKQAINLVDGKLSWNAKLGYVMLKKANPTMKEKALRALAMEWANLPARQRKTIAEFLYAKGDGSSAA